MKVVGGAAAEPLYWSGPLKACGICGDEFGSVMYDARTKQGPWGNLCEGCFNAYGVGVGIGRGQKYERQESGRYMCVAGR